MYSRKGAKDNLGIATASFADSLRPGKLFAAEAAPAYLKTFACFAPFREKQSTHASRKIPANNRSRICLRL
jgi:hypothetical protein